MVEMMKLTPVNDKNNQGSVPNRLSRYLPTNKASRIGMAIQVESFENKIKPGCHQGA
jgi:hypothetical protein